MALDPLTTLRKCAAMFESLAAMEQSRGPAADLQKIAANMAAAAQWAEKLAGIEDRRGIVSSPVESGTTRLEVEPVSTPEATAGLYRENEDLRADVVRLQRQLVELREAMAAQATQAAAGAPGGNGGMKALPAPAANRAGAPMPQLMAPPSGGAAFERFDHNGYRPRW